MITKELEIANKYEEKSWHYDEFYKRIARSSRIDISDFKCQKMARYAIINLKYTYAFDIIDFKNITLNEYMDFIEFIDKNIENIYVQPDFFYNINKRQWSNGQNSKIERPIFYSFKTLLETSEVTSENIEKWKKIYSENYSAEIIKKSNAFTPLKEFNIKMF